MFRARAHTSAGDVESRVAANSVAQQQQQDRTPTAADAGGGAVSSSPLPSPTVLAALPPRSAAERERAASSAGARPRAAVSSKCEPRGLTPCKAHFLSGFCELSGACPYLHDEEAHHNLIRSPAYDTYPATRARSTSAPAGHGPTARRNVVTTRVLPVFMWTEPSDAEAAPLDEEDDERRCLICFEQFDTRKPVTALPCIHKFHAACVFPWVKKQGTCPKCFESIVPATSGPSPPQIQACSSNRTSASLDCERATNGRWMHSRTRQQSRMPFTQPTPAVLAAEVLFGPRIGGVAWVPDTAAPACMLCRAGWSLFRRKHHCRSCGMIACSTCTTKEPVKGYRFKQLCCVNCSYNHKIRDIVVPPWNAK
ncbi:E3 ubiquitin-protein ligase SDIR1 [Diplonema papillatum]|nr:E3 ubiquitin-protein ligase SDIR1 [Diplonema papillatum]